MADLPQTRRSLLLELGKQSDEAWAEFLEVYESAIYRLGRARGLQDADARDVTQEVVAALHQRLSTWDPDASRGSFRAWLLNVARNVSVDTIAARARWGAPGADSRTDGLLSQVPDERGDPGAAFDAEYRRSLFEWASRRVRGEVRDVTWRSFYRTAVEGRKADEVAAELGIPVGSVYTAKCRVVARIRAQVAELDGGQAGGPEHPGPPPPGGGS